MMNKKIASVFITLVVLLIIAIVGIGVYLSLAKKLSSQNYLNPTFGYTLRIPDQYEVLSDNSQEASASSRPIKTDNSCIVRKSDNACIVPLEATFDDTKPSISTWLQNLPEYFKALSLTKTEIGAYDAAAWEADSNINYLFMDNGLVLHAYFLSKNSEIAKTILKTIKLKK